MGGLKVRRALYWIFSVMGFKMVQNSLHAKYNCYYFIVFFNITISIFVINTFILIVILRYYQCSQFVSYFK